MTLTDSDLCNLCAACYTDPSQFDTIISHQDKDAVWIGVKKYPNIMVAVCRGSITFLDWWHDFMRVALMVHDDDLGMVHPGFLIGIRSALSVLEPMIDKPLIITGHSLGAAHAFLLAALHILHGGTVVKITTFGPPRPGNWRVRTLLAQTPGSSYRNGTDPVAEVPFDIPEIERYVEPFGLIPVNAPPPAGHEWGDILAWHHIQQYRTAMAKLYA
jgi:pimeloyl-ACP methyl ester carboxylesterase